MLGLGAGAVARVERLPIDRTVEGVEPVGGGLGGGGMVSGEWRLIAEWDLHSYSSPVRYSPLTAPPHTFTPSSRGPAWAISSLASARYFSKFFLNPSASRCAVRS